MVPHDSYTPRSLPARLIARLRGRALNPAPPWRPFAGPGGGAPSEIRFDIVSGIDAARAQGLRVIEVRPESTYRRDAPAFANIERLSPERRKWFETQLSSERAVPAGLVAEVGPAIMFGHGYVAMPNRGILAESICNTSLVTPARNYGLHRTETTATWTGAPLAAERIIRGPAATLRNLGEFVWGHWIMELLPRIELFRAYPRFDRLKFVVAANTNRVFYDSLLACGIAADNILEVDPSRPIGFENHVCVTPVFDNHRWIAPGNAAFLHAAGRRALAGRQNSDASAPRRIFLTRDDARHRKLLNQDAVLDMLRPAGFVPFATARESFARQVEIFSRAEAVIAVMGSGVSNLVFSPPGADVIYLAPNRDALMFFTDVALIAGHRLGLVFGESVAKETNYYSDFTIEIDDLRRCLRAMDLS
ncbi:MAG: DUF563 domain-containing protein [Alphaproteobacteria bacterium]